MSYDKEVVKDSIDLEDIYNILDYFGGEPDLIGDTLVSLTICHNGDSHKLYYYNNTKLFHCYTHCGTFDIFELVQKIQDEDDLNKAIYFVVNFLNLQIEENDEPTSEDWKIFKRYSQLGELTVGSKEEVLLPEFDAGIIKYYPQPHILNWEAEHISKDVCDFMNIRYDPVGGNILIPHKDKYDRLIGIRTRTLIQEQEIYGKYRPWKQDKTLYNHPLAFNLYGLAEAQENIKNTRTAVVVESEKSVLQYISYFGTGNDICVAVCGSSLSKYQFNLLLKLGVQEIVIGFDRDFEESGTQDYFDTINKLQKIYDKYGALVNISFLFDKEHLLGYKSSPLDHGKEAFMYLFRNRIFL